LWQLIHGGSCRLQFCGHVRRLPFPVQPAVARQAGGDLRERSVPAATQHQTTHLQHPFRIFLLRDLARKNGWTIQYDFPYGDLPNDVKDDNRAAVRRITDVLALGGLYLAKADSVTAVPESDELKAILLRNLESLAEAEHDGWVEYKVRQGWRWAPNRDDGQRLHNLLKPFRELPEKEREKDRNAVRYYPEIVARQGYRIVSEPPVNEMRKED
jgi:hypothetical protein